MNSLVVRIMMGSVLWALSTLVNGAEKMTPFEIPPHGKPELLLGNIRLEAPTAMAFDSKNRPYLINNRNPKAFGVIHTIRTGKWVTLSCLDALKAVNANAPEQRNMHANGELVIDDADCLYATISGQLVYSTDLGKTFQAYPCPGSLELRTGPGGVSGPPAICRITGAHYVDRDAAKWAQRGTLSVLLPEKLDNGLVLGEPIHVTDNCLAAGSGGHSGGTSFAATIGNRTHLVYAELPENLKDGGNIIHSATIDRTTRTVLARQRLVTAPPQKADVHTRPTITVDSKGYLHVLSGSHGQPFFYLRSLKPNDIMGGWTQPVQLTGRQCYASMVCDERDRLHSVFREWIPHASLGYSSATVDDGGWRKPMTLVHGANPKGKYEYGIFYHRLFVDRASTLYLSFTFFEFGTAEKGLYPEALAMSKDGETSWQLARRESFLRNTFKHGDGEPAHAAEQPRNTTVHSIDELQEAVAEAGPGELIVAPASAPLTESQVGPDAGVPKVMSE